MVTMPWPVVLVGLPFWLVPAFLLLVELTRTRAVRLSAGAVLAVALTFLYAVTVERLAGPGLPIWIEGLLLYGPMTLVLCFAGALVERWRRPVSHPAERSREPGWWRTPRAWLVVVFVGWSASCGPLAASPVAAFLDLRIDSPRPGLVLPLPKGLTLVGADRDCGSEACSDIYFVGTPDRSDLPVLTDRLWSHLTDTKGWERRRDNAACQRPGWFFRPEMCLFVDADGGSTGAVLKVHVTGAETVA